GVLVKLLDSIGVLENSAKKDQVVQVNLNLKKNNQVNEVSRILKLSIPLYLYWNINRYFDIGAGIQADFVLNRKIIKNLGNENYYLFNTKIIPTNISNFKIKNYNFGVKLLIHPVRRISIIAFSKFEPNIKPYSINGKFNSTSANFDSSVNIKKNQSISLGLGLQWRL
ncbi:MAG: hypothetical protein ABIO44_05025, partial [Saprospiraceae bacterium]